LKEETEN